MESMDVNAHVPSTPPWLPGSEAVELALPLEQGSRSRQAQARHLFLLMATLRRRFTCKPLRCAVLPKADTRRLLASLARGRRISDL